MEHICGLHGCRLRFDNQDDLATHRLENHLCSVDGCNKTYKSSDGVCCHLKRVHNIISGTYTRYFHL